MLKSEWFVVIYLGIALRAIVSLYSYSGAGTPPLFGDYEAQRHWQEITVNLSPKDWYSNTSNNNLLYWGLDYPPLTAYHSFLIGKVASFINVSFIELEQSRGIETSSHKSFMRSTVLLVDILIYIPSGVLYALSAVKLFRTKKTVYDMSEFQQLVIILLYPGQILIDNGHFQYNNVSIGLTALAIVAILKESNLLASIYFCLALNYKQMQLYHSIPFFIYLLKICCTTNRFFITFIELGSSVLLTFALIWSPWIHSIEKIRTLISRIFPLARGVYEDKVANFWCAVNVAIKLKRVVPNQLMAKICLSSTLISLAPSTTNLFLISTKRKFLYSLFNSALGFYLFSFQVHEKSILLTILPAMALFNEHPHLVFWFLQLTTCSMIPLFIKDGLILGLIASFFIYYFLFNLLCELLDSCKNLLNQSVFFLCWCSYGIIFSLAICKFSISPPEHYPNIFTFITLLFIFCHFIIFFIYFNLKQLG